MNCLFVQWASKWDLMIGIVHTRKHVSITLQSGLSVTCNWWITFTSNLISFDVSLFSHDIFSGRFFTNLKNVSIKLRKKKVHVKLSSSIIAFSLYRHRMRIDDRRRRSENIENIQKENWNSFIFFPFHLLKVAQRAEFYWRLTMKQISCLMVNANWNCDEIHHNFLLREIRYVAVQFASVAEFGLSLVISVCWRWWKSVRFQESSPPSKVRLSYHQASSNSMLISSLFCVGKINLPFSDFQRLLETRRYRDCETHLRKHYLVGIWYWI